MMLFTVRWAFSKCVVFFIFYFFYFSALVKLLNKSIEGTADDDEEGVTPDTAIRSGLELLKVCHKYVELAMLSGAERREIMLSYDCS